MESQQYDVSPEMLKLFRKKEQERAANKEYFRNVISNPHRDHLGPPFDPSFHRYHAMSTYHDELYKVGAKSYRTTFVVLAPIVLYYLYISNERSQKEREIREGRVRYQDRNVN